MIEELKAKMSTQTSEEIVASWESGKEFDKVKFAEAGKKVYPYGFKIWMNQLAKIGNDMKIWDISQVENKKHLDWDAWLVYFMQGLHPKNALIADIQEGSQSE